MSLFNLQGAKSMHKIPENDMVQKEIVGLAPFSIATKILSTLGQT